ISHVSADGDVIDPKADEIAAPKLAVDAEVEHRQIAFVVLDQNLDRERRKSAGRRALHVGAVSAQSETVSPLGCSLLLQRSTSLSQRVSDDRGLDAGLATEWIVKDDDQAHGEPYC